MTVNEIKEQLLRKTDDTKALEEYVYHLRETNLLNATQAAVMMLSDPDEKIRAEAIWVIEMLAAEDLSIVPALLRAANDPNLYVRSHAVVYLMEKDLSPLVDEVIAVLEDKRVDGHTRSRAALALGKQKKEKVIRALIDNLVDENPTVVWNVIHVIESIEVSPSEVFAILEILRKMEVGDTRLTPDGLSLAQKTQEAIEKLSRQL